MIPGLFWLAWFVLLATQANLVLVRNVKLHKKLAIVTFIVAMGVTLSTLHIFIVVWKSWGDPILFSQAVGCRCGVPCALQGVSRAGGRYNRSAGRNDCCKANILLVRDTNLRRPALDGLAFHFIPRDDPCLA